MQTTRYSILFNFRTETFWTKLKLPEANQFLRFELGTLHWLPDCCPSLEISSADFKKKINKKIWRGLVFEFEWFANVPNQLTLFQVHPLTHLTPIVVYFDQILVINQSLDSNIESNNTYLNIIKIFNKLLTKLNIIESQNLVVVSCVLMAA